MINLDSVTNENNKEHNEKWPYIPDYPLQNFNIWGVCDQEKQMHY